MPFQQTQDAKVDVHAWPGHFLGHKKSMRHAHSEDLETGMIKTAQHIPFNEGMNDVMSPPPCACFLRGELEPNSVNLDDATQDVQVSLSPLNEVDFFECEFHPSHIQLLGFQVE